MADDNVKPENTTEKSAVVVRRKTSGSQSGTKGSGQSSQKREVDSSSEASVSASVSASNQTSPRKGPPGSGSGNRERRNRERQGQEGHQQNRRGGGAGRGDFKRSQNPQAKSTVAPNTPEGSAATSAAAGQGQSSSGNKKNKRYAVKKRAPPREDIDVKPNDVFVNEKSNFLAQLGKCKKIFEKGHQELYLHGLGKAIPRAINLAFELQKFYHNTVEYAVNTSTIELRDDVIDLEDPEQPSTVRARKVSSVDIKVYRSINIP